MAKSSRRPANAEDDNDSKLLTDLRSASDESQDEQDWVDDEGSGEESSEEDDKEALALP